MKKQRKVIDVKIPEHRRRKPNLNTGKCTAWEKLRLECGWSSLGQKILGITWEIICKNNKVCKMQNFCSFKCCVSFPMNYVS